MIATYPVSNNIEANTLARGYTDDGAPVSLAFTAPINLKVNDRCTVETDTGQLFCVERNGQIIWGSYPND